MNIAILILCHKNAHQLNLLLRELKHPSFQFFVHVDKKSTITERIEIRDDIHILEDKYRVDVQWGGLSEVIATLNLLNEAIRYGKFDYFWLCSGQDYPIKPLNRIIKRLESSPSTNYINLFPSYNSGLKYPNNFDKRNSVYYPYILIGPGKIKRIFRRTYIELTGGYNKTLHIIARNNSTNLKFYYGSQWWCLNNDTIIWILKYLRANPLYIKFYEHCLVPDESFFHTLFMNSPYSSNREDYLHYIEWEPGKNSPKTFSDNDIKKITSSNYLMARKFDEKQDARVIPHIHRLISNAEVSFYGEIRKKHFAYNYSVLMSVYCKEKSEYLKTAIESMLTQTVPPEQFVLVEDGRLTDELNKVIDGYEVAQPKLFTVLRNKSNKGLGLALDEGMRICRNELVARMDSDDISMPDRCEKELQVFAQYPNLDIISGAINEFQGDKSNVVSVRRVPEHQEAIKKQMRRRSAFNHPAVMYKKSSVTRCGGYGGSARKEDHDLFSRMMNMGCQAYNIQEPILWYRVGNDNIKRRKSWKNVSSYIQIMWINLKRGYCSVGDFLFVTAAQIFYFIAPVWMIDKLLKIFYREES